MKHQANPGDATAIFTSFNVLILMALLILMLGSLAMGYALREAVLDDAYIVFRYAQNFARGNGLVFNPGERVEGVTCLLWTLVLAVGAKWGLALESLAQALALICNCALLGSTYVVGRKALNHPPAVALIAPMLVLANLNVTTFAAHGMETALFSLLLFWGLAASCHYHENDELSSRRNILAGLLLALATLARPEVPMYVGMALVPRFFVWIRERQIQRGDEYLIASYIVPVSAVFFWRHSYYGQWLPNTFYAKTSGGAGTLHDGWIYVSNFFHESLVSGLVLIPLCAIVWKLFHPWRMVFSLVVLSTVGYAVKVGGDAFAGARFFVPVLPMLYLLIQDGCFTLFQGPRLLRGSTALLVAALGLATVATSGPALMNQATLATSMTRNRAFLGKLLNKITDPGTEIALNTVGALPYYAGLPTIDMYGLTDAHIAHTSVGEVVAGGTGHAKGDGAYVIQRRPGFILLRNVWIADLPIEAHRSLFGRSEQEIAVNPRFLELYEPMNLPLRADLKFGFYKRRDISSQQIEERFFNTKLEDLGEVTALAIERGTEILLYNRGLAALNRGQLKEARGCFERSLDLYPDAADVHVALGQTLERLEELNTAREHFVRATQLKPDLGSAWLGLGNVQAAKEQPADAIDSYRRALEVDPSQVNAYANLGSLLLKHGRLADGSSVLHRGLTRAPKDVEMWLKFGTASGLLEHWADANEALVRLKEIAPVDARVVTYEKWLTPRKPTTQ